VSEFQPLSRFFSLYAAAGEYPDEESYSLYVPVYVVHPQVNWIIAAVPDTAGNYSLNITTAPFQCQKPINYTLISCPAANNYLTLPYSSADLASTDSLIELVFLLGGLSSCPTATAYACAEFFPICDDNNFAKTICVGNTCSELNSCGLTEFDLPTETSACVDDLNELSSSSVGQDYIVFSAGGDCVALPASASSTGISILQLLAIVISCSVLLA